MADKKELADKAKNMGGAVGNAARTGGAAGVGNMAEATAEQKAKGMIPGKLSAGIGKAKGLFSRAQNAEGAAKTKAKSSVTSLVGQRVGSQGVSVLRMAGMAAVGALAGKAAAAQAGPRGPVRRRGPVPACR
ncbi:MAG: hypothetical protein KC583_22995, partial [Myxococcales bacterium]|nr:hypothetical protein [Myxococcales bacterium]